jgi:hypothetical protein
LRGKLAWTYESLVASEVAMNKEYALDLLRRIYIARRLRSEMEHREELEKARDSKK